MQEDAGGCRRMQEDAGGCRRMQEDAGGCRRMQEDVKLVSFFRILQIFSGNLESGVWRYSRFFLEIWKSGNLEIWKSGNLEIWKSRNLEIWSLRGEYPPLPKPAFPEANVWIMGRGGMYVCMYACMHLDEEVQISCLTT